MQGDLESQVCLIHGVHPSCWQDGSVSCTSPPSPSHCLRQGSGAWLRHQGHIPTAQQCRAAWQLLPGRSMVRGNCKAVAIYSCCKDIPRASASHNANQSGSPPSDSCPRTNTAGTWLCSKGSHVSPLRGSLIHSKRYSSLDLRSNIYLSSLTPRLFSSFPVLSPRASAVWAHHTWAAEVPRGAEGFMDGVMYFRHSESPDPI